VKRGRLLLIAAASAVVLLGVLATLLLVPQSPLALPGPDDTENPDATAPAFATQAPTPPLAAQPEGPGFNDLVDQQWAADTAAATGIPREALLAYTGAIIGVAENFPECTLGWNTLAGIGLVESDHARHGGASIQPNGHVEPLIFGVPLTGGDVEDIPDTDGGEFDGRDDIDRAIGPMQIIPQTWRSWHTDGNRDGFPDPHNIYDAALAAANYLCHAQSDWVSPDGWRAGVASYNSAPSYAGLVASAAQDYADAVD
jgi:hypothetical protein